MKKKSGKFCIFLIFLLALTQFSCDAWSSVVGRVYDSQNNPIENATVQLLIIGVKENKEIYRRTVRTDKNGKFEVSVGHGVFNVDLSLIAAKDGYKISETEFTAKDIQKNKEQYDDYKIVLEKIE